LLAKPKSRIVQRTMLQWRHLEWYYWSSLSGNNERRVKIVSHTCAHARARTHTHTHTHTYTHIHTHTHTHTHINTHSFIFRLRHLHFNIENICKEYYTFGGRNNAIIYNFLLLLIPAWRKSQFLRPRRPKCHLYLAVEMMYGNSAWKIMPHS
jgi:hypothetical protein